MLIMVWSMALLSLSYSGHLTRLDGAYIASLLSSTLAGYGIQRTKEKADSVNESTPEKK